MRPKRLWKKTVRTSSHCSVCRCRLLPKRKESFPVCAECDKKIRLEADIRAMNRTLSFCLNKEEGLNF